MIDCFLHPPTPHVRKHGPSGYDNFQSYKPWLRDEFSFRCVFCLTRETWAGQGHHAFSVEHMKPKHAYPHLENKYENLVYSCCGCNTAKGIADLPFDPCLNSFMSYIEIGPGGQFRPKNAEGVLMIEVFHLNDPRVVRFREVVINNLALLMKSNTPDAIALLDKWLGWPIDIPDLEKLRPLANTKPDGLKSSFFALKSHGHLPAVRTS